MVDALFPSNAPLRANVVLVLQLGMGAALLFGGWLARRGQYRLHAWCQSSVVLLNLVVIAVAMAPSFSGQVLPRIPARLGRSFYAIATAHAVLGIVAEALAVYVVLAAGTKLFPARFRLRDYRRTMRIALAIWWVALLFGVTTYVRWYVQF